MALNFWSSCLFLVNTGIVGFGYYTQFVKLWRLNSVLRVSQESIFLKKLHPVWPYVPLCLGSRVKNLIPFSKWTWEIEILIFKCCYGLAETCPYRPLCMNTWTLAGAAVLRSWITFRKLGLAEAGNCLILDTEVYETWLNMKDYSSQIWALWLCHIPSYLRPIF